MLVCHVKRRLFLIISGNFVRPIDPFGKERHRWPNIVAAEWYCGTQTRRATLLQEGLKFATILSADLGYNHTVIPVVEARYHGGLGPRSCFRLV
jgi:hypothetical protein